ncbi:MAG: protein kinase [Deltaproteobacteria bacterium]|nr:protein kinase [Deltaproteobacteria bacterium]
MDRSPQAFATLFGLFDELAPGSDTVEMSPATTVLYGRYEVVGLLGAGGMGVVYKARDLALDEVIALKILRPELSSSAERVARFRQEVRLARRVNHPNIVRTFDLGEQDGDLFLTMELASGRSLARLLAEEGPPPLDRTIGLARQLLAGIGAAHQVGVLHCDLKPDNLIVCNQDRLLITDFGIARAAGGEEGSIIGTPAYMAPEQVEGLALDGRADLYAFGAVLFELLTGRAAWTGPDAKAVARARLISPPPDPARLVPLPEGLVELVRRSMARDPLDRPADAAAALELLNNVHLTPTRALSPRTTLDRSMPTTSALSVAVLPLRAIGEGTDAHLAEGLTEELIDALATTRGLRVRPLSAVLALPPQADAAAQGRLLGVRAVAEGNLALRGDKLHLKIRLIGVEDGYQLWSKRFILPAEEALSACDEVAQALAGALAVELQPQARAAPVSVAALDKLMRGRAILRTHWDEGLGEAIELLDRAAAEAPDDVGVASSLAISLARQGFLTWNNGGGEASLQRARGFAERALRLNAESGEAQLALAHVRLYSSDLPGAAECLRATLARSPGLARAQEMLGNIALEVGLIDEGITRLQAALTLDPRAYRARLDLARGYALLGRWDDADELLAYPNESLAGRAARYILACRFTGWAPRPMPIDDLAELPPGRSRELANFVRGLYERVAAGASAPELVNVANLSPILGIHPLLRAVRGQSAAEVSTLLGDLDAGMSALRFAVEAELHDISWMDHCAALVPLRVLPGWAEEREKVAVRANAIARAIRG